MGYERRSTLFFFFFCERRFLQTILFGRTSSSFASSYPLVHVQYNTWWEIYVSHQPKRRAIRKHGRLWSPDEWLTCWEMNGLIFVGKNPVTHTVARRGGTFSGGNDDVDSRCPKEIQDSDPDSNCTALYAAANKKLISLHVTPTSHRLSNCSRSIKDDDELQEVLAIERTILQTFPLVSRSSLFQAYQSTTALPPALNFLPNARNPPRYHQD